LGWWGQGDGLDGARAMAWGDGDRAMDFKVMGLG